MIEHYMLSLNDLVIMVMSKNPTAVPNILPQRFKIIGQLISLVHASTDQIRYAGRSAMTDNQIYLPAAGIQISSTRNSALARLSARYFFLNSGSAGSRMPSRMSWDAAPPIAKTL